MMTNHYRGDAARIFQIRLQWPQSTYIDGTNIPQIHPGHHIDQQTRKYHHIDLIA